MAIGETASVQMRSGGDPLKIIEIGDKPLIKLAYPEETWFFSTAALAHKTDEQARIYNISPATIPLLHGLLSDPSISLIVCHPTPSAPWNPRIVFRAIFNRRIFGGHFPLLRWFGPQFLRRRLKAPLVIVDQDDFPLIDSANLFLLKRCKLYFKRELPVDRWRVFLRTAHVNLPTYRFRRKPHWAALVEKLRPISLGLPLGHPESFPQSAGKTADLFFAGRVEGSSWVRKVGMAELEALRAQGVRVDYVQGQVSREEFYARCAASWLTWSPEGYGWDCFRHYEALACGSIPVCNQPTIERYQPLLEGRHAFFYTSEPGALQAAVLAALADKDRLQRMAAEGRLHVMAHHRPLALAQHIVEEGLGG